MKNFRFLKSVFSSLNSRAVFDVFLQLFIKRSMQKLSKQDTKQTQCTFCSSIVKKRRKQTDLLFKKKFEPFKQFSWRESEKTSKPVVGALNLKQNFLLK